MRTLWVTNEGLVVNVVEYSEQPPLTEGEFRVIPAQGNESPGDIIQLPTTFKPVTRRQMLTALHRAGILESIKAAVDNSGDVELQIAFNEALDFERNNPMLVAMAQALGKTEYDIDAIFALAETL